MIPRFREKLSTLAYLVAETRDQQEGCADDPAQRARPAQRYGTGGRPIAAWTPSKSAPRIAAASSKPRAGQIAYAVVSGVANAHNQCRTAPTRQPVSSGLTTGLPRICSHKGETGISARKTDPDQTVLKMGDQGLEKQPC